MYIFAKFFGLNLLLSGNFLCNEKKFWGSSPPYKFFDKLEKSTFFISYCETIFPVGLIINDTAVICETIEWVFNNPIFPSGFHSQKPDLGRQRKIIVVLFFEYYNICDKEENRRGVNRITLIVRKIRNSIHKLRATSSILSKLEKQTTWILYMNYKKLHIWFKIWISQNL